MKTIAIIPALASAEATGVRLQWKSLAGGLLFFGLCAAVSTYDLAGGDRSLKTVAAAIGSWLMTAASVAALWITLRRAVYVPGSSFRQYRLSASQITRLYRWLGLFGVVSMTGALAAWALFGLSFAVAVKVLLGGAGAILAGYYGRIAQRAHADIDHAAVALLREAGQLGADTVYAAYMNFDPAQQRQEREGDVVFATLADRIVALAFRDGSWVNLAASFKELAAIGISTDQDNVSWIKMRFDSGLAFSLKLDPGAKLSTEPLSFIRGFLSALDAALLPGAAVRPASRRRRTVAPQHLPELPSAQAGAGEVAADARSLEFDSALVARIQDAPPYAGGRVLEL